MNTKESKAIYVCTKARIYSFLAGYGILPIESQRNFNNPKLLVWIYDNSDGSVTEKVSEYYLILDKLIKNNAI